MMCSSFTLSFLPMCIPAHNTGEPLDTKARQQFHLLLWRQASLAYEGSEFSKALSWYNYSLSLFPAHGDKDSNIAKLQVSESREDCSNSYSMGTSFIVLQVCSGYCIMVFSARKQN